jgi:hypothetical protein
MIVNERLFKAGLIEDYDRAKANGSLNAINTVLVQIQMQQDAKGMNWER